MPEHKWPFLLDNWLLSAMFNGGACGTHNGWESSGGTLRSIIKCVSTWRTRPDQYRVCDHVFGGKFTLLRTCHSPNSGHLYGRSHLGTISKIRTSSIDSVRPARSECQWFESKNCQDAGNESGGSRGLSWRRRGEWRSGCDVTMYYLTMRLSDQRTTLLMTDRISSYIAPTPGTVWSTIHCRGSAPLLIAQKQPKHRVPGFDRSNSGTWLRCDNRNKFTFHLWTLVIDSGRPRHREWFGFMQTLEIGEVLHTRGPPARALDHFSSRPWYQPSTVRLIITEARSI
jgi:hypothetical protein